MSFQPFPFNKSYYDLWESYAILEGVLRNSYIFLHDLHKSYCNRTSVVLLLVYSQDILHCSCSIVMYSYWSCTLVVLTLIGILQSLTQFLLGRTSSYCCLTHLLHNTSPHEFRRIRTNFHIVRNLGHSSPNSSSCESPLRCRWTLKFTFLYFHVAKHYTFPKTKK